MVQAVWAKLCCCLLDKLDISLLAKAVQVEATKVPVLQYLEPPIKVKLQ
jgi:hypothetical protein